MKQMDLHSNAQIQFIARNFDKVFEDSNVAKSTGQKKVGSIMMDTFKTQFENEEILETNLEFDQDDEPVRSERGSALLEELRSKTTVVEAIDFAALAEIQERRRLETKPKLVKKASEHIRFCLPVYATREVQNSLIAARNFIANNQLDSHLSLLHELETSFERLQETTQAI